MTRLDLQRSPGRVHARLTDKALQRGHDVIPHSIWGNSTTVSPAKASAKPGDMFGTEPTIVAQDSTNAGRLAGLGYVASPTSGWTSGQKITVSGFQFNWSGVTWAAGAHA